jgi:hypothetical protein
MGFSNTIGNTLGTKPPQFPSLEKSSSSKPSSSTNYYCRKMSLNHLMDDFSSIKNLKKTKTKKTGLPENLEKRLIK